LRLVQNGSISGIGPWLFCAPFKILTCYRKSFWLDGKTDEIRMPLGLEVVRGFEKLIAKKTQYTQGIDASMFSEEEGGLLEGMATVEIAHGITKKIAQAVGSRALHVNSGLYLLGRGEV